MKKIAYILPLMLLLSGCGASMVSTRGDSTSQFAPKNESEYRGGLIKYLNQGANSIVKSRREDAYRQMSAYCGGAYNIVQEGPVGEGSSSYVMGGVLWSNQEQFWYINFQCEK